MSEVRRQFRAAAILILIIIPIGVLGYVIIEGKSLFESIYLTIITLTTIGYGDIVPVSPAGQVFTLALVFFGFGSLAFFLSSSFALIFSAEAVARRRNIRIKRKIDRLNRHYVICGKGELVDKTIGYVLHGVQMRRKRHLDASFRPIDKLLIRVLGKPKPGEARGLRLLAHRLFMLYHRLFVEHTTLLDLLVVITDDAAYADHLGSAGILVIFGDPGDNDILLAAGILRARAIMVMLDQDTESLLTVLTSRNLNPRLYVTAAAFEEEIKMKMMRAGANVVLAPYEVAAQFLNSATLRPAVNDFFNSILFDQETHHQITQLELEDESPWIGKRISELDLRARHDAGIIGIRLETGDFAHTPGGNRVLAEDEILLVVAPGLTIPRLRAECGQRGRDEVRMATFQKLIQERESIYLDHQLSLSESAAAIADMSKHFVICGDDQIIQSAVRFLNPSRPFVLLSNDEAVTQRWLGRGFRVVHGNPTREEVLLRAGVDRAQAIMISIQDKAAAVLSVISARSISKPLLIAVTATTDDMVEKLQRSGADRVVSPFHVAAQFVLLSTTRPEIADFLQHVLYNEVTSLETAELYMEDDSPWIGKSISELALSMKFRAGVIGIREANSTDFMYAPPLDHVVSAHEVLIVITPMEYFDEMRAQATGHKDKRPATLRLQQDLGATGAWSRDMIRELIEQQGGG